MTTFTGSFWPVIRSTSSGAVDPPGSLRSPAGAFARSVVLHDDAARRARCDGTSQQRELQVTEEVNE
jgi:hypothetical protein